MSPEIEKDEMKRGGEGSESESVDDEQRGEEKRRHTAAVLLKGRVHRVSSCVEILLHTSLDI